MSSPPGTTGAVHLRPWYQFIDTSSLSLPISLSESTYRLTQNLRYFLPNYAIITLLVFLLTLITRPLSLILFLCISAAWIYALLFSPDDSLTLLGFDFDRKYVLGFLGLVTLVAVVWAGVWWGIFVALIVGVVIAVFHGVLKAPEDSLEDSPYGSLINVVDGDSPRGDYASGI